MYLFHYSAELQRSCRIYAMPGLSYIHYADYMFVLVETARPTTIVWRQFHAPNIKHTTSPILHT